jgi:hypothetical protein
LGVRSQAESERESGEVGCRDVDGCQGMAASKKTTRISIEIYYYLLANTTLSIMNS